MNDEQARKDLGRANYLAQEAGVEARFVYRRREPGAVYQVWQDLHPREIIAASDEMPELEQIKAGNAYNESSSNDQVTHLVST